MKFHETLACVDISQGCHPCRTVRTAGRGVYMSGIPVHLGQIHNSVQNIGQSPLRIKL